MAKKFSFWTDQEINDLKKLRNADFVKLHPHRTPGGTCAKRMEKKIESPSKEDSAANLKLMKPKAALVKQATKDTELVVNGITLSIEKGILSKVYISKKGIKVDF